MAKGGKRRVFSGSGRDLFLSLSVSFASGIFQRPPPHEKRAKLSFGRMEAFSFDDISLST